MFLVKQLMLECLVATCSMGKNSSALLRALLMTMCAADVHFAVLHEYAFFHEGPVTEEG